MLLSQHMFLSAYSLSYFLGSLSYSLEITAHDAPFPLGLFTLGEVRPLHSLQAFPSLLTLLTSPPFFLIFPPFFLLQGFQNFHHTFPEDYRTGSSWLDIDPLKWLIWSLSLIGFTSKLKTVKVCPLTSLHHGNHFYSMPFCTFSPALYLTCPSLLLHIDSLLMDHSFPLMDSCFPPIVRRRVTSLVGPAAGIIGPDQIHH